MVDDTLHNIFYFLLLILFFPYASIQCVKFGNFSEFPGGEIFRKHTVSADFRAIGKLGKISTFYTVIATNVTL